MDTNDKPLSSEFESPDYLTMIAYFANLYRHELITAACCLGGFVLGRLLQPAHPIEKCISKFSSTSKSESQIKSSLQTSRRFTTIIKRGLFLACLLIVSYLCFVLYTDTVWVNLIKAWDLNALFVMKNQIKLLAALGILICSYCLVGCYAKVTERRMVSRLNNTASNKRMYIEKLFGLFGAELIQEIQNFLQIPKESEPETKNQLKQQGDNVKQDLVKVNASLQEEVENLKDSIAKTRSKLGIKEKILAVNESFMNNMMSFEWCSQCYDDKKIEEFVREQQKKAHIPVTPEDVQAKANNKDDLTPKKSEPLSDSKTNVESTSTTIDPEKTNDKSEITLVTPSACQANCLIRFHIFCDQLAQKMRADLDSLRFRKNQ